MIVKPIIGITAHVELDWKHTLANDYIQAVICDGGIPLIISGWNRCRCGSNSRQN